MDVEHILHTLNQHSVEYILIGGMNFLFNHSGPITYDVDIFVNDTSANLIELNFALQDLHCEWGESEDKWGPISSDPNWLKAQTAVCLTSPFGPLDIYRKVRSLDDGFDACKSRAELRSMPNGDFYFSLCDEDMLGCELAAEVSERNTSRIDALKKSIAAKKSGINDEPR